MTLTPLHTDGRHIKNQQGQTLKFVGGTESQTSWRSDTEPFWKPGGNPIPMATRMKELNVTWVRIFVSYARWSDPVNGAGYRDLIDRFVKEFTDRDIYCMVGNGGNEFLPETSNGITTGWTNFLKDLANRYISNPGMCGIYIWNEPPTGRMDWRSLAAVGAATVSLTNPNLLININVDLPNRMGVDPFFISNPIPVSNFVYVYHDYYWMHFFYNQDPFTLSYAAGDFQLAKQQMEQTLFDRFFKYAVDFNFPIMLEEFGFNGGQNPSGKGFGNEPGWPQCQIDYMNLLDKYEIPWNEYSWWVKTDTNYGLAQESDYRTLSPVGEIWKAFLPSPTPSPLPASNAARAALVLFVLSALGKSKGA